MKSMYVSVLSLIVALITLFYVICVGVETEHSAMLISVLGALVTALMGWNIVQYLYAKEVVRTIAKEESDKAAREAANRVRADLKHIVDALSPLVNARVNSIVCSSARAIGWYCTSLDEYNHIEDSSLRQEYLSDLFEEFLHRVEMLKEDDCLCIDKKHLDNYISLLDTFDNLQSTKLKELIQNAREETEKDRFFDHVLPL